MTWAEDLAEAVGDIFAEVGEAATYNGNTVTIIDQGQADQELSNPGPLVPTRSILIRSNEVAKPRRGDVVVIAGKTYTVQPGATEKNAVWTIYLSAELIQM